MEYKKLNEILEINPKITLKKGTYAKKIAMENIKEHQMKIETFAFDKYKGGSKFQNGDTLLARITPCLENGKLAYVDILEDKEIAFGSTEFFVIRGLEGKGYNKYIYYLMNVKRLKETVVKSMIGTSGRQRAQKESILNYEYVVPDYFMQKKIGEFLYLFDKKIEINKTIINNLEQISQTLFKRWFIDFEFPNEEGQPYKSSGGKMVESELGEIPEGWEIKKLGTIVSNKREKYKKEEKLPYVPINELPMKKMLFYNFLPPEQAKSSLIKFNKNDILIGNMRVYFHRVCLAPFEGVTRTTTFVLKPLTSLFRNYILLNLFTEKFVDFANQTSKGTTIPYAVWENGCENFKVIFPNDESILKKFNDVVDETILKSLLLLEEIDKLEQLRDTLLPKLLSGEIEIPDDLEV